MIRPSEVDERLDTGRVVEWQSPAGHRIRWERERDRIGWEGSPGLEDYKWLPDRPRDKRHALRIACDTINREEL